MKLSANVKQFSDSLTTYANGLNSVADQWTGQGLEREMRLALGQVSRFVAVNIQVDEGRAKNSVFPNVQRRGNSVVAGLYSNLVYFPYVGHRQGRSSQQAFRYAERVEVPKAIKGLQDDFEVSVEASIA